jgi:uncharacterized coiled-coil protein SlyX
MTMDALEKRIDRLEYAIANLDTAMHAGFARTNAQIGKIGVMIEDLDAKFRLLMEGFGSLDRRVESLEVKIEERFREVDYKFEVVFERFQEMDARFDELDAALAKKLDREEFSAFQVKFAV